MIAAVVLALLLLPVPATGTPTLTGRCAFGDVTQTGRAVTITGGPWTATGELRRDGTLQLFWLFQGRQAVAIYRPTATTFEGVWGWAEDCEIDDRGNIVGDDLHAETIQRNP